MVLDGIVGHELGESVVLLVEELVLESLLLDEEAVVVVSGEAVPEVVSFELKAAGSSFENECFSPSIMISFDCSD